ncbi:MAG TPA: SusC/RagA family TonB-linked outer membrane protein, partial [Hymenobacter sp.]
MKKNIIIPGPLRHLRVAAASALLPAALLCAAPPAAAHSAVAAQTQAAPGITVSGRVADEKGAGIPGVTVVLKGSTIGVSTSESGAFSLNLPSNSGTLVISSVGFMGQEIAVSEQTTTLNVVLRVDVKQLNDVVVVGYGTQRREDVTGAISSVSAKEISQTVATTVDQALQGRVPGVVVNQNTAQPGGGVSVQIRGIGTLNGDQEPLYVIDGVIIPPNQRDSRSQTYAGRGEVGTGSNPLSSLNPNEIESIDILKDASATAIYGAQASNGVVVITTKRGKAGPPKLAVETYYGLQQIPSKLDLMDLRQFTDYTLAKQAATGGTTKPELLNSAYLGKGTDWQEELFRTAPMYSATARISGGDDRTQYLLSGSYFKQEGIALGSDFRRASARLNLDNKTTKFLKIGTSLQLSNTNENLNSTNYDLVKSAITQTPDIAVRNPDGSFGGPTGLAVGNTYNPNPVFAATLNTNKSDRNQVFGNVYGEIYFLKDFTLRNEASLNFDMANYQQFFPSYELNGIPSQPNSAYESATRNLSWTVRNYLTYNRQFKKYHNVNAMFGHEASSGRFQSLAAGRRAFPSNTITTISAGDETTDTNSGGRGDWALESYFGRVTLGFFDKYILTSNFRRDGSANFAPENRWVTTHSYALAWKLGNEEFFKNISQISDLKVRLGYGLIANQNVGSYVYGAAINLSSTGIGQGGLV